MNLVVDANLIASLFLPLPYSKPAAQKIASWKQKGVSLYAPTLLLYELSTVFRKAIVTGYVSSEIASSALDQLMHLGVVTIPPTLAIQETALRYAEVLGQSEADDAHYLAVAKQLQAQLWTADKRLANAATEAGLEWVRWIGDA